MSSDSTCRVYDDESHTLLQQHQGRDRQEPIPAVEVSKVARRLKFQVEQLIQCEVEVADITSPTGSIISKDVTLRAKRAGGDKNAACVVYCLLMARKWFNRLAVLELWDAELHNLRAICCDIIAKRLLEDEQDHKYLFEEVLLQRYSILTNDGISAPANALETAVDLHALHVIASSAYQQCISYLWKGWLVQDDDVPTRFVEYKDRSTEKYLTHFDPDRMRAPIYQNTVIIAVSVVYLVLYSIAINTINPSGDIDMIEGLLYTFTAAFIFDEVVKLWKVGSRHIGFWNAFNGVLYGLLVISFVIRMIAVSCHPHTAKRKQLNELSYNFLAFSAPMFWGRLLLYLDMYRFFGVMLLVVKVMMKESLIFFALLAVILAGFLQAFLGLDQVDNKLTATNLIMKSLANTVMASPDFDEFNGFAPPFGIILYYIFNFLVIVVLLNILIALYNSAYAEITENAVNEYMALFAHKTIQFVRAPDENVFIPPFNLIEVFFLIMPFEWWLSPDLYEKLNVYVMGIIYSPLLLYTAYAESKAAKSIKANKFCSDPGDSTQEDWNQVKHLDMGEDDWLEDVQAAQPQGEDEPLIKEVKNTKKEVQELRDLIMDLEKKVTKS